MSTLATHSPRALSTSPLAAQAAKLAALAKAEAEIAAGTIPALYLKKGRALQRVTPEQAAVVMEIHAADRASDDVDDIPLHDAAGAQIGYVSYNGRTWLGDLRHHAEIPQRGRKTCAQLDREGWHTA